MLILKTFNVKSEEEEEEGEKQVVCRAKNLFASTNSSVTNQVLLPHLKPPLFILFFHQTFSLKPSCDEIANARTNEREFCQF